MLDILLRDATLSGIDDSAQGAFVDRVQDYIFAKALRVETCCL